MSAVASEAGALIAPASGRPIPDHGTAARYAGSRRTNRWEPCRCSPCRDAYRLEAKKQELRRIRGLPSFADRAPVAAHLQQLLGAGWTLQDVADVAHLSRRNIYAILHGDRPGVRHRTAAAILALHVEDRPTPLVPAIGSVRRVQALAAMGWSIRWIGEQAAVSDRYIRYIAAGRAQSIGVEYAERIRTVFDRFAMVRGRWESTRTLASRHGWAPPLAWDDDSIDDPNARPHPTDGGGGLSRDELRARRRENAAHLTYLGLKPNEVSRQLGISEQTVRDDLAVVGDLDLYAA